MEAMRSTWTDSRLDDLKDEVVHLGTRIDAQGARIDSLTHTILLVGGGLFAAFIAFTAALVGVMSTQL
jgi:hypothetical protein